MKWDNIKNKKDSDFRRMTGFKRKYFDKIMIEIIKYINKYLPDLKRCRPCRLCLQEQFLITIMYWREYRSMLHIGMEFGLSESAISRTITKIENILKNIKAFKLPDRKKLTKGSVKKGFLIVDSTEVRIERPKKNKKKVIREKNVFIH